MQTVQNTQPSNINVRNVAAMVLTEILSSKKNIDEALATIKTYQKLDTRDKAFVRIMVAHTLRCLPSINKIIDSVCKKSPPEFIRNLISIAISQLSMGTEPYAAVYETVSAAPARFRSFVNAVLRNISTNPVNVQPSIESWIYKSWVEQYGLEMANKIAEASLKRASLDITVKPNFKDKIGGTPLTTYTHRFSNDVHVTSLPGFEDGEFWVQDIASTAPCLVAGDVKGKSVIDLCAAPGGKSFLFHMLGANLVSVDNSPNRIARMQENANRLKYDFPIINKNVLDLDLKTLYDVVLIDPLCSATGTIRRHPELPYIKTPELVLQIIKQQKYLLEKASKLVKNDGILIWSVCSLDKREGIEQIDEFLKNHTNFKMEQIEPPFNLNREITTPYLQLFPFDLDGMDGFFIAKLRKLA